MLTPAVAPLSAKTKVPTRSSTSRSVSILALSKPGDLPLSSPGPADRPPYGANQARGATIKASTPVCKVGWITGAKRGLWLVWISLSRPACLAFA